MATAEELAPRLSEASVKKIWDVYSAFDWPESLDPLRALSTTDLQRDLLRPPYVGSRTPIDFPEIT